MLFSIIIPTRNRPDFLRSSIQSVLAQEFGDYEIIVSDNSSSDMSTIVKRVVKKLQNEKIRYIRPDSELPMGTHWQWAVQYARGDYTGILTDRMVLKRSALTKLEKVVNKYAPLVISYIWDAVSGDAPPYRYNQRSYSNAVLEYSSQDIVESCSCCIFPHLLPRALNCFVKSQLLIDLYSEYGRTFDSISPDYFFCFVVLDFLEFFHHLDAPLSISWGDAVSNGTNYERGRMINDVKDFMKFMDNQGGLKYAPIRTSIPIPYNGILHEYNYVRSIEKSGKFSPIRKEAFYIKAVERIERIETRFRLDMRASRSLLENYRSRNGVNGKMCPKDLIVHMTKKCARPVVYFMEDKWGMNLRWHNIWQRAKPTFQNIEEVLEFDQLSPRTPSDRYHVPEGIPNTAHRSSVNKNEIAAAENRIDAMKHTLSWRITAPFRDSKLLRALKTSLKK